MNQTFQGGGLMKEKDPDKGQTKDLAYTPAPRRISGMGKDGGAPI